MKAIPEKKKATSQPFLHRAVQYKFAMFLQHFPPKKFNREFCNMFIDYLAYHRTAPNHRINRELMVEGVWDLIRVLDETEDHWAPRNCDEIIRNYNRRNRNVGQP